MTCSKMTHALTGWICLDASHMKHKRRGGAASDLYWCRLAKGGNQPYMSNLVNFPRVLCSMVRQPGMPVILLLWCKHIHVRRQRLEKTATHSPPVASSARAVHSGLSGQTHVHSMSGRHILEKHKGHEITHISALIFNVYITSAGSHPIINIPFGHMCSYFIEINKH